MPRDTHVDLGPGNPNLDPNRVREWSVPPVLTDDAPLTEDQGIILTRGVIYLVQNSGTILIQNVNIDESDSIAYDVEFSFHGDPEGVWHRLASGSYLAVKGDVFLLNRHYQQNISVAISPVSAVNFL